MNRRMREDIERTLRREDASRFVSWSLQVGGRNLRAANRVRALERSEDDGSGVGISLSMTLAGLLPDRVKNQNVRLTVRVGEHSLNRFLGEAELPERSGGQTTLLAHTPGYWLDKAKLNVYRAYKNQNPETVAYDVLSQAPYDKAQIRVEDARIPEFRAHPDDAGSAGYMPFQSLADVLTDLALETGYVIRDTSYRGVEVRIPPVKPASPEWSYDLGPGELTETAPEAEAEGEYSRVVIFRVDDTDPTMYPVDGARRRSGIKLLTSPLRVPGSQAPDNAWLWLEVSDYSAAALKAAMIRAYEEVDRMSGRRKHGEWVSRVINPLIVRGTTVTVVQRDWDDDGSFVRRWIGEVTSVADDYVNGTQTVGAEMYLVRENRVIPPLARPAVRTGAVRRALLGKDNLGNSFIDTRLPFVGERVGGDTVALDEVTAAAMGLPIARDLATNQVLIQNTPARYEPRAFGQTGLGYYVESGSGAASASAAVSAEDTGLVAAAAVAPEYFGVENGVFWIDRDLARGRAGVDSRGVWVDPDAEPVYAGPGTFPGEDLYPSGG